MRRRNPRLRFPAPTLGSSSAAAHPVLAWLRLLYPPVSGRGLPAVAISHGWLQPAHRYVDTMRYLASWGFVVVAPDTQKGPIPSHGAMALDVAAALRLVSTARLGNGRVSVDDR